METALVCAGLALVLALLVTLFRRRAKAISPPEDLRRRRMSWPPPSGASLLLARLERAFWCRRPKGGGRCG